MTPHDPSERARRALERMEDAQARSRARFQEPGPERALLVELLESSCLLELGKIEPGSVDAVSYARLAAEVLAQLYPIAGCIVTFDAGAGRSVTVHAGSVATVHARYPLVAGGDAFGELATGPCRVGLVDDEGFLERAVPVVARGLRASLDAELLRREAATATAARIASDVGHDVVGHLGELVAALASFPGVIGADLVVEHAAVGALVDLRAGYWDDDGHVHAVSSREVDVASSGRILGRLRSVDDVEIDGDMLDEVLARLGASLERLADVQRLREEAETEPLSGVGDRRRLERVLASALARAGRLGEQVAVLVVDVDRLESVNDAFGHGRADDVLLACVAALRESVRPADELARSGGDGFVVVARVRDVLDALRLADGMRVAVAARCRDVLPPEWAVSANIGLAVFPDSGHDVETLLRAADAALIRAKREGRNGVAVAAPSSDVIDGTPRRRVFRRSVQ